MNSLVRKKGPKNQVNSSQKTFNRLKKKVDDLQEAVKLMQEVLDDALSFYFKEIKPMKTVVNSKLIPCIKLMHEHYKNLPSLSDEERQILKGVICKKISDVMESERMTNVDPELYKIFKELTGIDFKERVLSNFNQLRQKMEKEFSEYGIDIDLSNFNFQDEHHIQMQKLHEALHDLQEKMKEDDAEPKKKTKREFDKEKKEQELEDLKNKGLSPIYKQLVKVLHPDLEQDPLQKKEKEELMKKLTSAYENNDLHTLLSLEMQWMTHRSEKDESLTSDEQVKIYNSILKDQVTTLEENFALLIHHPKYTPIRDFIKEFDHPKMLMKMELEELKEEAEEYEFTAELLQTDRAEEKLCDICTWFTMSYQG